ncbi:hypothetical protein V8J82_19835 [Gymnodinialimonas sp. 2305UL16-5]|uniref:hypothetical protein n=1 Tax=Gymnodinialimonas mytili TaxID=3126503 RepID=UPI0030A583F6
MNWDKVGTPGSVFTASGRTVVGMTTNKAEVFQFDDANTQSARLRQQIYGVYAWGGGQGVWAKDLHQICRR